MSDIIAFTSSFRKGSRDIFSVYHSPEISWSWIFLFDQSFATTKVEPFYWDSDIQILSRQITLILNQGISLYSTFREYPSVSFVIKKIPKFYFLISDDVIHDSKFIFYDSYQLVQLYIPEKVERRQSSWKLTILSNNKVQGIIRVRVKLRSGCNKGRI